MIQGDTIHIGIIHLIMIQGDTSSGDMAKCSSGVGLFRTKLVILSKTVTIYTMLIISSYTLLIILSKGLVFLIRGRYIHKPKAIPIPL